MEHDYSEEAVHCIPHTVFNNERLESRFKLSKPWQMSSFHQHLVNSLWCTWYNGAGSTQKSAKLLPDSDLHCM